MKTISVLSFVVFSLTGVCWILRFSGIKNRYEKKDMLEEYILSQYGVYLLRKRYSKSEYFYKTIIEESRAYLNTDTKVLDVGCALGRLVYEYEKMGAVNCVGIDSSKRFIDFSKKIKSNVARNIVFRPKSNSSVQFIHGDIFVYPFEKSFDFISCINVLDRVPNPKMLIERLYSQLEKDGTLLIVCAYDWCFSPAPKIMHVNDMKVLFNDSQWEIKKEIKKLPYFMQTAYGEEVSYLCHLLIVQRKS